MTINNIQEQLVSFEVAKLLKEAGFGIECEKYYTLHYDKKTPYLTSGIEYMSDKLITFDWNCNTESSKQIQAPYPNTYHESQCSAPTQQLAIDWIRVNFEFNIYSYTNGKIWYGIIQHLFGDMAVMANQLGEFNTPEEAKESALEYCLTKLILKK